MKLSIIVPVYNERKVITEVLERIEAVGLENEIVIVDDGPNDGTTELLQKIEASRRLPSARFIFKRKNAGKGAALRTGIEEARGDIVLTRTRIWSTTHGNIPDSSNPLLRDTPMSCMAHDFYPGRIESYFSGIRLVINS